MKMSQRFSVGEIVFAKIKGYRPWPAVITYVSTQANGKINYHVVFYGTGNSSVVGSRKIWNICDKMAVMGNPRKCKRFAAAIKDMIASLELEDPYDTNETLRKINDIMKKPTPKREVSGPPRTGTPFSVQSPEIRTSKCVPLKKRIIGDVLYDTVQAELMEIQGRKESGDLLQLHSTSPLGRAIEGILTGAFESPGKNKRGSNVENEKSQNKRVLNKADRKFNGKSNSSQRSSKRTGMTTSYTNDKVDIDLNRNKNKGQNPFSFTIKDTLNGLRRIEGERYAKECYKPFDGHNAKTERHLRKILKSVRDENGNENKPKIIPASSEYDSINSVDPVSTDEGSKRVTKTKCRRCFEEWRAKDEVSDSSPSDIIETVCNRV